MIKSVFLILLGVHLLGDFYFQTQKMADRKRIRFSGTLFHSAVYAVTAWILCAVFIPGMQWSYILAYEESDDDGILQYRDHRTV